MDKGVTAGDYTVYVGKGTCLTTDQSLSGSKLLCIPPDPIPEKSNDFRSKYHNINVSVCASFDSKRVILVIYKVG